MVTPLEERNQKVAYRAALEGIVLLENDGCLPVSPCRVALYGAGAAQTIKGGTGSGEVSGRHAVSILEGLENAGFMVTSKPWIDDYRRLYEREKNKYKDEFRQRMIHMKISDAMNLIAPFQMPAGHIVTEEEIRAASCDTCIYVVSRQAGEGSDRKLNAGDYSLSETEYASIGQCARSFEKMIVVINTGSVFDMGFLDEIEGINAVIYFGQQGAQGGNALADLISGKETFSGKLADTWAKRYEDYPGALEYSYLNGNLEEEYYKEGIYVGYRYFDSYGIEPRYPFGYGLSYTAFSMEMKKARVKEEKVKLRVAVTNTGDRPGKEIVQVYAVLPQKGLKKEFQRLVGFAKTGLLAPGETEKVKISFRLEELSSYRTEDAVTLLEAGDYVLMVGNSSRNTKAEVVLRVPKETILYHHSNICTVDAGFEADAPDPPMAIVPENLPCIEVSVKSLSCTTYQYEQVKSYHSEQVDELLERFSLEEMACLAVGEGMIGKRFFEAPGSAGSTTYKLLDKGVPNVSLADGPAGLRLQRYTAVMKNGKLKAVEPNLELMEYLPEKVKKAMFANPDKHPVVYQFTTAFPVESALAQTWNRALLEDIGAAVGDEMVRYGVTYWLAPALNIHRNPLCGRNFEYYSEDPYLSGVYTAAITKGVQKNRGCYVTIKHFCCNNQEDNRNHTNANVSERALREIYLRGFGYAVKHSNPGAVMSSYNKVNGEYANNSYDLMTKILRNEWGFDGVLMTDWMATGRNVGSHVYAIEAGHDLLMPGNNKAIREIVKAVEDGILEEEDVRRAASRVLRGVLSSRIYQGYLRLKKE